MRKKRHNYSVQEKVTILKRHLVDRVAVSDLCDEYQLARVWLFLSFLQAACRPVLRIPGMKAFSRIEFPGK